LRNKIKRLLREPLFHFLLIGAGLFILFGSRGNPTAVSGGQASRQSSKIVVTQGDIDQMVAKFKRTWQRSPTGPEVKELIEGFVRDEIYYREAVAIGLDKDDPGIRQRLRQKMEFIFEDITTQSEPTDEELTAFMKRNSRRYLADPQISFRQVYVNPDKRGKNAASDSRRILAQLREGADPATAGDPILIDPEIHLSPLWDIRKQFGEEFSKRLLELGPGRWEGPVRSAYGLHLVFVRKRVGGRLPELSEVREMVERDWLAEKQKALKDAAYARLRGRYSVVVEQSRPEDGVAAAMTAPAGAR
jgi:hypothetical protein